ncbi:MAG: isoprenyl transferase [Pelagibacterales bacterium]|nr:isoprenyl transferase [Pelagibacterales bacterium]
MFFCNKNTKLKQNLKIPSHVAIIMDGNARWAKSKNLPIKFGHKTGSQNVEKIADACIEIGIKHLTIYAFSSENWDRPKDEVDYLMNLMEDYLKKETASLMKKDVKIVISGDLSKLSTSIKLSIESVEEQTKNNKTLLLNVAFSYGSRQEIVNAVKKISLAVASKEINVDDIKEETLIKNLYQPNIPDPELLIRTAGDIRLSNFILWQAAYSELYFTKVFWPDFSKKHLVKAIKEFNKRERRYGKR